MINCFCGKLSSFSPSVLFFFGPSFLSLLHLALAGAVAARRALPLRAAAVRFEPNSSSTSQPCHLALGWLGLGGSGKGAKLTPVRGTQRASLESIAPGQGVGRYPSACLPGSSLWKLGDMGGRAAGRNEAETQRSAVSCPDTLAQVLGTLLINIVKVRYSYQ